ncbi:MULTISPECIES: hypothetical protein [unclassified Nonomuraea]|uniref:hypothetical protein n=1 Tax=unclassified Nonomuraea TaxID=2593643 RepID=UPI0033D7B612
MPIKDWVDGERPPASDLNRYPLQQVHVIKTADQTNNTTTLADDNHLSIPVEAGTDYWIQLMLIYEADDRDDLKISFSAPSGATFDWMSDSLSSNITASNGTVSRTLQGLGNTPAPGGVGQGTLTRVVALPRGVLRVAATAGTFRLRWAKLATTAGVATTIYAGSLLRARRLTT